MLDEEEYICVINNEEQYSIWVSWKEIPHGWKKVGFKGSKEECLKYIREVWTNMKPKSLRKKMDKAITVH